MTIRSGLGAQLGIKQETSYGTYGAPDHWFEFNAETLKLKKTTVQGGGIAAGRFAQLGSRRVLTTVSAVGDLTMEVANKGFGVWLANILGSSAVPVVQGATSAYLQTHVLGDNFGRSITLQKGVPDLGTGTANPYTYLGGKVTDAEFTGDTAAILLVKVGLDFKQVVESQTLAAPSYPTTLTPFHGMQMAVRIGPYGAEVAAPGVNKITLKVERPQNIGRTYAGAAGLKAEPVMNAWTKVTGTIDADYLDKTVFADRVASDAPTSLVAEWVGPVIAGAFAQTFRIRVPMIFLDTDTPVVSGPDIIKGTFGFTGEFDGTNPQVSMEYLSSDSVI